MTVDVPALVGPYRGRCGLCGDSDARHRVLDSICGLVAAGDDTATVAADFEVTEEAVIRIVAEYQPASEEQQ